jgi:hypothetical protein
LAWDGLIDSFGDDLLVSVGEGHRHEGGWDGLAFPDFDVHGTELLAFDSPEVVGWYQHLVDGEDSGEPLSGNRGTIWWAYYGLSDLIRFDTLDEKSCWYARSLLSREFSLRTMLLSRAVLRGW